MSDSSLASYVDCGAGTEVGFCSMTSTYPVENMVRLLQTCDHVTRAWSAVVTDDVDQLGDNSASVITSHQVQTKLTSFLVDHPYI